MFNLGNAINLDKKTVLRFYVLAFLITDILILFVGCAIGPQPTDVVSTTPVFYEEDKAFFLEQLEDVKFGVKA